MFLPENKYLYSIVVYFCFLQVFFNPSNCQASFSFSILSDQGRVTGPGYDGSAYYFEGALVALNNRNPGAFLVNTGDMDPAWSTKWTIEKIFGPDFFWFPVVGNHDLPGLGVESFYGDNMQWLRQYNHDPNGAGIEPDIVNQGPPGCPETTYSFDYGNAHFVVLNVYCSHLGDYSTDGNIPLHLYDWLVQDLQNTTKDHIFVFGHEPAFPQPDVDNGRERHMLDSLNAYPVNRDRFWSMLKDFNVVAYFCGHTHNFSAVKIDGVWQVNVGHAIGALEPGAPGTFVKVFIDNRKISYEAYREEFDGVYDYDDIIHRGILRESKVLTGIQSLLLKDSQ